MLCADPAGALTSTAAPTETESLRNKANYLITDADRVGGGSLKQKCRANLDAIELLKQLEAESRPASDAEKRVLVRYVGWGGLPQVFDQWNEQWQDKRERLETLHMRGELQPAIASMLYSRNPSPTPLGKLRHQSQQNSHLSNHH